MRPSLTFSTLLLATCCHRAPEGDGAPKTAPKKVHCAAAAPLDLPDRVELRGVVSPLPDRDAQIAPQVAGRIARVLVREGDDVKAGQLLVRVDDASIEDQAREADAARAKVAAELKNAEATLARVQRVFEHGIAAKQEVDDAVARVEVARASLTAADAVAERARRQVDRTNVKSPLAGVVVKVLRGPGELVDGTAATPVLEVADTSRLELVADAPAADIVRMRKTQNATITVAAMPGTSWDGAVAATPPAVDRSTGLGTVRVELALGSTARPPIGTLGVARVDVGSSRKGIAVPDAALRAPNGDDAELVLCNAGTAAVRKVHVVAKADGRTAVEGIAPDDRVVVDPVMGVSDGEAIEAVP